jgi:hypothetical protein
LEKARVSEHIRSIINMQEMVSSGQIHWWLTLGYGLAVLVIAVVYWRAYGPTNFLWLSDIALALTFVALLTSNRLLASMIAVGVLALELAWTIDFLAGGRIIRIAAYMYDSKYPLYLRALSAFHLALPPTLLFLLYSFGYDERALIYQTLLTWLVLIVTYVATDPEKNINWVFGPGEKPQQRLPPLLYLGLEMAIIPLCVLLPTHFILKRFF